LILPMGLS
jgi:enoyl-CoA hydratase